IEAVRSEIGREVVLGVRISADELMPGEGLTLADMCQVAEMLEATGALDYMSVSVANYTRWGVLLGDISVPPGGYVPLAAEVRKHVSLPVIAAIRINRPELAERVLAEGS